MKDSKQVIVVRKDLNMRKGKMIAQGAHAAVDAVLRAQALDDERLADWLETGMKKICVGARSEAELLALYEHAMRTGVIAALIQDAGLTEFGGVPTYTALAIGPDREDRVDAITGELSLL